MRTRALSTLAVVLSLSACAPKTTSPTSSTPATTGLAKRYAAEAGRIQQVALIDDSAYRKLAYLTDRIGNRLSGSKSLDAAIAWASDTMQREGHENVHTEKVMVPHWVRGEEWGHVLAPVERDLHLLGLGGTVATPAEGLEAEVVAVPTLEAVKALGESARGKIVLINQAMPAYDLERGAGYGGTVVIRRNGPVEAAKVGAVAVLIRSVTHTSLQTPHTGSTHYDDDVKRIPAAAVTIEDAELLSRWVAAGVKPRVRLRLSGHMLPDAESANVVAELVGRERSEEIVLIGAHLDSWDVGQGAHDDGTGVVTMMQALTTLRELGMRPRRTIRLVLFTNEENGLHGATEYAAAHADEVSHHVVAIESDGGGFAPRGFHVSGNEVAMAQAREIAQLLEPFGANRIEAGYAGADMGPLNKQDVPGMGLWVDGSKYFDYHHTHADTLDKVNAEELAANVAAVATMVYVLAEMPERFGQGSATTATR